MGLATNLPVKLMHSITYRITGLMFLSVALTVFTLIFLANEQMTQLFQEYLTIQHMQMVQHNLPADIHKMPGNESMGMMMGPSEQTFLASVHQSLIWVGMALLVVGLGASYTLARSITIPLRNLSGAAEQIAQGNFKQKVPTETRDEVGQLADIFNRMAATLETNDNLRRQLLANIAHELRTPLAIIQGHLEGMLDGVIDTNKEQITSLHEEAIRLNRLIKDLHDLSLAEVRQLALEKMAADINQLLSRAIYMLKPLADEKEIAVVSQLADGLPEITVDTDRISQVFYNILVNAIRYSPSQSTIKVSTDRVAEGGQSWLRIAISDTGPGIAPEDVPYLFDHFYRGDKSRDRKSGGSGLGLAVVKQLVEIHGGRVTVESKVGEGSVFQVWLPVNEV